MTLKREIKDAYIENGNSVYIKTHSNAIYVDENETETLTQRLNNVKGSIKEHTTQLNTVNNDLQKKINGNSCINENLLLNSDFVHSTDIYSNWRKTLYPVDLTITTNGIVINSSANNGTTNVAGITQIFDTKLKDGTYTISICVNNQTFTGTGNIKGDTYINIINNSFVSIYINNTQIDIYNCNYNREVTVENRIYSNITIEYIKLEKGNLATPFIKKIDSQLNAIANGSNIIKVTRDITLVGTQKISFPFKAKMVNIQCVCNQFAHVYSHGYCALDLSQYCIFDNNGTIASSFSQSENRVITVKFPSGGVVYGVITKIESDGITITWSNNSKITETGSLFLLIEGVM